MNAYQFSAVLIIGIFTSRAYAGEQQQQDQSPIGTLASTQEGPVLQAIRWRLADSCYQNSDCAARASPGTSERKMLRSQEPAGESPSTPERRRALGLTTDVENQR